MTGRGQTTLDYSVGVSIFLTVVIFTVAFIPTMFAPFDESTGQDSTTADRIADRLAYDVLAVDALSPGVWNSSCTAEFFDNVDNGASCRYPEDADTATDLRSVVGVDDATQLNVTVRNENDNIRTVGGKPLAVGKSPSSVADPVVATRAVLLDGEQSRLLVRVW